MLAVERAVVEDVNAPILPDDGGEAAPARKKKRRPVAVLAERASVKEGSEVKRSRRDRSERARCARWKRCGEYGGFEIRGGVGRRRFRARACECGPAFEF